MNPVEKLNKLAELSDLFDLNGEYKAADEVDTMMRKFAEEEGLLIPQQTLENMLENVEEINSNIEDTINFLQNSDHETSEALVESGGVAASSNVVFYKLAEVADCLDQNGEYVGADLIDNFLNKHSMLKGDLIKSADPVLSDVGWEEEGDTEQSKRYDDRYHHNMLVKEPKRDQDSVDREGRKEHHVKQYQERGINPLRMRNCPDHPGSQLGRVGEGVYQCPIDGAIYDWEVGFTKMDGEKVPGGSVAGQTELSTPYASPHRIFDSRQNIINTVN